MKKAKILLSTILVFVLLSGLTLPSLAIDIPYYVYDSDDMEAALADSTVTTIIVMNNFTLDDNLEIPRDIDIVSGAVGDVIITSAALDRHFYIDDQASISITFSNVILNGNSQSGGIFITDSYVTIDGADIEDCYTENNDGGGAILANNQTLVNDVYTASGSLTITNSTFDENVATIGGGAIASYGQISISGSTITDNSTEKSGGGIMAINYTAGSVTATISSSTIDGNHADLLGGGVCVLGITATINGATEITGNTATSGGGVCSVVSYTSISSSTIQGNIITSTDSDPDVTLLGGAGIYSIGRLSLNNTTVNENEANFNTGCGVGILAINSDLTDYEYSGTESVTITGGTINGNKSYYEVNNVTYDNLFAGGGIAALDVDVTVTGTTISTVTKNNVTYGNNATYGGAILTIGKTLNVTNCTIDSNTAATLGGGIYTASFFEVISGTGNYDFSAPDINVSGGQISNNTSLVAGGGIMLAGGDVTQNEDLTYTYESQLNIDDAAEISTNVTCFGGGIAAEYAEITIDGASAITENSALGENISTLGLSAPWSGAGGGIMASQSSLTLGDCEVSSNTAAPEEVTGKYSAGGGIYATGQTSIAVNDENTLITANYSDNGGGIYNEGAGTINISNGLIRYNISTNGAGVYSQGNLTISGGIMRQNNASSKGGAVYSTGTVTMTGGIIGENESSSGGGIYSTGTVTMTGGYIGRYYAVNSSNNVYENGATRGGGIYSTGTVTISGGSMVSNVASTYGGGIYSTNIVCINGGIINANTAFASGGGIYGKYVTFEANGTGVVSNNSVTNSSQGYGGGLYISSGGTLTMNSGEISYNTASRDGAGVYVNGTATSRGSMTMTNYSKINNNTASRNGGGVCLYYSDLTMSGNSEIYNNTAAVDGGGVECNGNSTVTVIPPASIHDNSPNNIG